LERVHPDLPMAPGQVRRREFEYIRHGTQSFILNRDVVTGQIGEASCGPRRTEVDFAAHIARTLASDPQATRWHFVVDNLNIHQSESLVRLVAAHAGMVIDLGVCRRRNASGRCADVKLVHPMPLPPRPSLPLVPVARVSATMAP